jgi:hypothetical protein
MVVHSVDEVVGPVRLFTTSDDLGAMLFERCEPGTPLRALPE